MLYENIPFYLLNILVKNLIKSSRMGAIPLMCISCARQTLTAVENELMHVIRGLPLRLKVVGTIHFELKSKPKIVESRVMN